MNESLLAQNGNGNVDIERRRRGTELMRKWRANPENRKREQERARQPKARAKSYAAHKRRLQNPEYRARYNRYKLNSFFRKTYGLTIEQRDELFSENGGLCMICNTNPSEHVDHCHDTGLVRGALCTNCNLALGHFRENAEILRSAIQYLTNLKGT